MIEEMELGESEARFRAELRNTARTARAWLLTLGYLSNEQIDTAVAYTQEEGEPKALVEIDKDDFDEMVEEMEMGEDEEKFLGSVEILREQPKAEIEKENAGKLEWPLDALLEMTRGREEDVATLKHTIQPKDEELTAKDLELTANRRELTAKDEQIASLKAQLQKLQQPNEGLPPE